MTAFTVVVFITALGTGPELPGGPMEIPAWLIHPAATAGEGPSFDCAAAEGAARRVCDDPALAALDRRLADRFAAALAVAGGLDAGAGEAVATLRATERGWIKGRDACWKAADERACIRDAYLAREGALVARWMLEKPSSVVSYTCADNPANEVTLAFFDTELPAVRIEYGDGVDVGSLVPAASGSRYEASFGRFVATKGDALQFAWTEGEEISCTAR